MSDGWSYHIEGPVSLVEGLTLRDYFAVAAMSLQMRTELSYIHAAALAKNCYDIADAMLAEREKEDTQ